VLGRRLVRVAAGLAAGAGAAALLAGCSSAGGASGPAPTWQASPAPVRGGEGGGGGVTPIVPVPGPTGNGGGGAGSGGVGPGGGASSSGGRRHGDPLVVATRLVAPVGLTLLPDGSALVGERTSGRIVRVQPVAGQPVPTVRRLTGLDSSGDGGLLDLAVSPSYAEDNLVYAYITTARDNRVVEFTLHGPITPVLTGIPKGRTGNAGRIAFGADGDLYVGTGSAGRSALAQEPKSLAGKVLRIDPIGDAPRDNPHAGSPVWSSGYRGVAGLCATASTVFEVEPGASPGTGDVNRAVAGDDYGFPVADPSSDPPVGTLPRGFGNPGGCAVLGGRLWVTSLDGTALLAAPLTGSATSPTVGKFAPALVKKYGRLRTVVAAPDGALWLTTSNRDGHGRPVAGRPPG
jgi:hypothetical protein